jgi:hypothetical protein
LTSSARRAEAAGVSLPQTFRPFDYRTINDVISTNDVLLCVDYAPA